MTNEKDIVLIVNAFHPETVALLDAHYITHHLWELPAAEQQQLIASLDGSCRAVATASWDCNPLIYGMQSLQLIAAFGVGVDGIDFGATGRLGCKVSNTPDVLNDAVADLAMALVLATSRNLVNADRFVRNGQWADGPFPFGSSLDGKTLGIIGLGRIGEAIAERAKPFRLQVAYHNRQPKPGLPYPYYDSIEALAAASDILLCMLPGGQATNNLVDAEVFQQLGSEGIFINVGRGNSVDEDALCRALRDGTIKAAGLDVYRNEPQVPDCLQQLDNVVLLPHIGSATVETRRAMGQLVIDNLAAFFAGKPLLTEVT
jgi:lactate dehydrogenase-like 2-hydroxyacid dehydrogenase